MKSHYLEHTLTRDNVIKDENYDKALQIVLAAIKTGRTHLLGETAFDG